MKPNGTQAVASQKLYCKGFSLDVLAEFNIYPAHMRSLNFQLHVHDMVLHIELSMESYREP